MLDPVGESKISENFGGAIHRLGLFKSRIICGSMTSAENVWSGGRLSTQGGRFAGLPLVDDLRAGKRLFASSAIETCLPALKMFIQRRMRSS